ELALQRLALGERLGGVAREHLRDLLERRERERRERVRAAAQHVARELRQDRATRAAEQYLRELLAARRAEHRRPDQHRALQRRDHDALHARSARLEVLGGALLRARELSMHAIEAVVRDV